jgi:hypothetical protein
MADAPFWKQKTLAEMTRAEWESLCDGCGKCCLNKIDDPKTGRPRFTDIACRLLDIDTCRCTAYEDRTRFVPECRVITPGNASRADLLPSTCAYRLLAEGQDLPDWHPLVSGHPESVHRAGVSVRGRAVSEREVGDLASALMVRAGSGPDME